MNVPNINIRNFNPLIPLKYISENGGKLAGKAAGRVYPPLEKPVAMGVEIGIEIFVLTRIPSSGNIGKIKYLKP